jgi:hypothetical protein
MLWGGRIWIDCTPKRGSAACIIYFVIVTIYIVIATATSYLSCCCATLFAIHQLVNAVLCGWCDQSLPVGSFGFVGF